MFSHLSSCPGLKLAGFSLPNVGGAPYFSSIVIGAVMAMAEKVRSRGGRCAFCNASAGMRDILSIMKIDSVLPYFATRDEALRAVGNGEDAPPA
ncbi:MAG: STAS domain-containing protein [Planctomycetes bacterium]|nr:STAS domain-containing protein [Planctomycetota bacterium]